MQAKRILDFLKDIAANNNRPWFQEHREEYLACKADFEKGIAQAISRIASFDSEIVHLQVKDCVYRFYRDTRFSPDKSPYKRHLGAYICAKGKKALRGGYYIHLEPGNCLLATGSYWLPTGLQCLKSCPSGFPKDYEFIQYLRMKDYCCWKNVPDTFFEGDQWLDEAANIFKVAKPMMDFMNSVIDDYE